MPIRINGRLVKAVYVDGREVTKISSNGQTVYTKDTGVEVIRMRVGMYESSIQLLDTTDRLRNSTSIQIYGIDIPASVLSKTYYWYIYDRSIEQRLFEEYKRRHRTNDGGQVEVEVTVFRP